MELNGHGPFPFERKTSLAIKLKNKTACKRFSAQFLYKRFSTYIKFTFKYMF